MAPEYAPISKKQTRNEQKTTNKSPRRPLPQPHTTRRELELQCSKESLGAGLRSDKSIATKGHQVSEPNTQAIGPRGQLRLGERELPRAGGDGDRDGGPTAPSWRQAKPSNSSLWPPRLNHQGLLQAGDPRWGVLGMRQDPTVGSMGSGTGRRSRRISWTAVWHLPPCPPPPPGWGSGEPGEAEGSRFLWI